MKRTNLALLMVLVLVMSLFCTGCLGKKIKNAVEQAMQSNEETTETEPEETEPEESASKPVGNSPQFMTGAGIEETVLVDQGGIKITATELTYTGNRPELHLTLENNTDETLQFISGSIGYSVNAVNGYMIGSMYVNEEVLPGKISNEKVTIDYEELQLLGINEIAEIQIGFDIQNDDYDEVLVTGAKQIKTSVYDQYDLHEDTFRKAMSNETVRGELLGQDVYYSEEVVYDDGGVIVDTVLKGTNEYGDNVVYLEAYNNGSSPVNVEIGNVEIDGIVVCKSTWTSETVLPEKHVVIDIDLDDVVDYGSADIDLDSIGEIIFTVGVSDEDYDEVAKDREVVIALNENGTGSGAKADGKEVYNSHGIRIIYKGINEDSFYSEILFYVENQSGKDIEVTVDSLSVNDIMFNAFTYADVADGKTGTMTIELFETELEENDLEVSDITEVEFGCEIMDSKWNTIDKPTITVNP